MSEEPTAKPLTIVHEIPYLRLFPWLRMFSTPREAAGPARLVLATAGIALMFAGWIAIDGAFPDAAAFAPRIIAERPPFELLDRGEILGEITEPARLIFAPFLPLFDREADLKGFLHAVLASLWTILVWSVIGGAIARIAVLRLARGERLGFKGALRFSARKLLPLIGAPLVPLLGFVVFSGVVAIFGLIYRIPSVGPTIAGGLAFIPLLVGIVLTLILVGLAGGWPLMPASVAAEEEDGFDAMSRAYAYLHQRPWHYGFYILLAVGLGAAGLVVVKLFAMATVYLASFALSFGAPSQTIRSLYHLGDHPAEGIAPTIHAAWLILIQWLARGWIFSYFWTAFSAIYLLLRKDVDGMPFSKVAAEPVAKLPQKS